MTFLACAIAVVASLYILLTQGLAVLAARRTGVLIGKPPSKTRIERDVDAERFDELLDARVRALLLPAFIVLVAICILLPGIFAATYILMNPGPRP